MKKVIAITATLLALTGAMPSYATNTVTVDITNITHGTWFTPLLVVAHRGNVDLFEVGEVASAALERAAEEGDVTGLKGIAVGLGASVAVANPAPMGPGESATAEVDITGGNRFISVVGMLLPTNDGFVGLDSVRVRSHKRVVYANGYDAGTEINDELLAPGAPGATGPGIPGDPSGAAGGGGLFPGATTVELNTHIHLHPGVVGDSDPTGGISDLDPAVHNWQNPVARIVISR